VIVIDPDRLAKHALSVGKSKDDPVLMEDLKPIVKKDLDALAVGN